MEAAALRAANSASALQQYVGIKMLGKIKDIQQSQTFTMLADFTAAQKSSKSVPISSALQVGANIDIKI